MEARYMCGLCGRNKFPRKSPHYCVGGYRKHKIIWIELKPLNKINHGSMELIETNKMKTATEFLKEDQEKEGKDFQRMYPYSAVVHYMNQYSKLAYNEGRTKFVNQERIEGKKEGITLMRDACIEKGKAIYSRTFDEPFIDTGSIRRIAEEEILKLRTV